MPRVDVVAQLGSQCEIREFEAENLERTLQVFEYINRTTGSNLTAKDAYPLSPASTYLSYDQLGLSICLVNDRVSHIMGYTGVASGYDDPRKNRVPIDYLPSGANQLSNLSDVERQFGRPAGTAQLTQAPIPENDLVYAQGISFAGRAEDGLLSRITIMKRKRVGQAHRA